MHRQVVCHIVLIFTSLDHTEPQSNSKWDGRALSDLSYAVTELNSCTLLFIFSGICWNFLKPPLDISFSRYSLKCSVQFVVCLNHYHSFKQLSCHVKQLPLIVIDKCPREKAGFFPLRELLFFSHSVVFESLRPNGLQHARLPCPSPSPGACSNTCPLS